MGKEKLLGSMHNRNSGTKTFEAKVDYTITPHFSSGYAEVTADLYARKCEGAVTSGTWSWSFDVDGSYDSGSGYIQMPTSWHQLNSSPIRSTVYYGANGTGDFSVGCTISVPTGTALYKYCGSELSGNVTINLPNSPSSGGSSGGGTTGTIWINSTNFEIGDTIVLHMDGYPNGYEGKITFSHRTQEIISGQFYSNTFEYTIPEDWLDSCIYEDFTQGSVKVQMYDSSRNPVGNSIKYDFFVEVPLSVQPSLDNASITLTPIDVQGHTTNYLVQNKTGVRISVSGGTAGQGAEIDTYVYTGPNSTNSSKESIFDTPVVTSFGQKVYYITLIDSRQRSVTKQEIIECYPYDTPYFTNFEAKRLSSDKTSIQINCDFGYSKVNNTNNITLDVYYVYGSNKVKKNIYTNDNTNTHGSLVLTGLNSKTTYSIYAVLKDAYGGEKASQNITVFGDTRIMNIMPSGMGIALGKMAETESLFDCGYSGQFANDLKVGGNLTVSGNIIGNIDIDKTLNDYITDHGTATTNGTTDEFGGGQISYNTSWNYKKWGKSNIIELFGKIALKTKITGVRSFVGVSPISFGFKDIGYINLPSNLGISSVLFNSFSASVDSLYEENDPMIGTNYYYIPVQVATLIHRSKNINIRVPCTDFVSLMIYDQNAGTASRNYEIDIHVIATFV